MPNEVSLLLTGGIGDTLFLTPSLRMLKAKNFDIYLYCTRLYQSDVLKNNPNFTRLYPSNSKTVSSTFRANHRLVDVDYSRFSPNETYNISAPRIIAELLDLSLEDDLLDLFLTEREILTGLKLLSNLSGPKVAFHITSSGSQNKEWPKEKWIQLISSNPDLCFVQIGRPSDPKISGAIDLTKVGLRIAFAVIAACSCIIGLDSGLTHAAAALKIPGLVLFGPSSPEIAAQAIHRNIYSNLDCSPCLDLLQRGRCPFGIACMNRISVELVTKHLRQLLGVDGA